jgi:WD40 repeat protein
VLRGHTDEIHGLAISETAQLVASASKDGDLKLWKLGEEGAAKGYTRFPPVEGSSGLLPDHSRGWLRAQSEPSQLVFVQGDHYQRMLTEVGGADNVLGWFGTNLVCYWNGTNGILLGELRGTEFVRQGPIMLDVGVHPIGVAYDITGELLAWSEPSYPNSVFMAGFAAPGRRVELKGDVPGLVPRLFSDDGHYLAAWSPARNSVRAWNVETGQIVASVKDQVSDALLAAGGRVLVVVGSRPSGHEVAFYDLAHPERAPRRLPGRHASHQLAVSPNGGLVASTSEGGEVRLFDPVKGELLESLHGHINGAFGVAFSPDGRRLISAAGGRDAIKLWDVDTRQELLTLGGTGGVLHSALWTADGNVFLAGSPWQAWRAPSWEEIHAAEARDPPASGSGATGNMEGQQR